MPVFQGCSEICGCRLPAKVVGRLRGEEFPHLEAASSARSAWVRRLCAPRAAVAIQAMLHETKKMHRIFRDTVDLNDHLPL